MFLGTRISCSGGTMSKLERGWEASVSRWVWRRHSRSARTRRRRHGTTGSRTARSPTTCRTRSRSQASRAARGAIKQVIAGKREGARTATASKVVKLGKTPRRAGRGGRGPVRRARAREDGQDLRRAGRVRRRARSRTIRTRTRTRTSRARRRSTGRCTTRSRRPTARKDNTTIWQADYSRDALPAAVLRHGRRRRVAQDVLRAPVLGPLQRRRPGHRLGQGPLQRGPLRPQRRLPVRGQRVREHAGT